MRQLLACTALWLTLTACTTTKIDPVATCDNGGPCTCDGNAACDHYCDGKDCAFTCSGTGNCTFLCDFGGCSVKHTGSGAMDLKCNGGACNVSQEGSGAASLSCGGIANCKCTSKTGNQALCSTRN